MAISWSSVSQKGPDSAADARSTAWTRSDSGRAFRDRLPVTCMGWQGVGSGASQFLGLADQPPEASAAAMEAGEQPCACPLTCTPTCSWSGPGGNCETAVTALADSVPCGPAWPKA